MARARRARRAAVLYHVTETRNVGRIRKRGILPLQPSHWAKGSGERYGEGEIFAFEKPADAIRWAGKMDWAQSMELGTGKISIVEFLARGKWLPDVADPLTQAGSEGRWLKFHGAVKPDQIIGATKIGIEHMRTVTL